MFQQGCTAIKFEFRLPFTLGMIEFKKTDLKYCPIKFNSLLLYYFIFTAGSIE